MYFSFVFLPIPFSSPFSEMAETKFGFEQGEGCRLQTVYFESIHLNPHEPDAYVLRPHVFTILKSVLVCTARRHQINGN